MMTQQTNDTFLEIPDIINFGEDEEMLDYDQITQLTKDAKKKAVQARRIMPKEKIVLTPEETQQVDKWVKDLEKQIAKFAAEGSDRFIYKCKDVQTHLFYELAHKFKEKNPKFYVETHGGTQDLTVAWHGKNEV